MSYFNRLRFRSIRPKSIRQFLRGFLPSKYVVGMVSAFYMAGVVFAYLDPLQAQSVFNGGFLLGNFNVQINLPLEISTSYLYHQIISYLGKVVGNIFLNNLEVSLQCIFTGFLIIPSIFIGLFSFIGSVSYLLILKVGFIKALIVLGGCFHLYFEFLAGALVIEAFLKFYGSIVNSFQARSTLPFRRDFKEKFLPLILRIIILLALGALIEVFWSTWWVYILMEHYISWPDFYLGVNSAVVL